MTILPGETACLACLMTDVPPPGTTPTCDTAGIIGPIVNVIASIESAEALENPQRPSRSRQSPTDDHRPVGQSGSRRRSGQAARQRRLPRVQAPRVRLAQRRARRHIGRALRPQCRATQRAARARPHRSTRLPPGSQGVGNVQRNSFLLRLTVDDYVLTVFPDGRTIVGGTNDVATARIAACTLYRCVIAASRSTACFRRHSRHYTRNCAESRMHQLIARVVASSGTRTSTHLNSWPASSQLSHDLATCSGRSSRFAFRDAIRPIQSADPVSFRLAAFPHAARRTLLLDPGSSAAPFVAGASATCLIAWRP